MVDWLSYPGLNMNSVLRLFGEINKDSDGEDLKDEEEFTKELAQVMADPRSDDAADKQ